MSAFSVHQSLTLPQKIDSREVQPFWGYLVLNVVQYGAKRSAFWCKMQCVLVQNTLRFGAKCKVKGC